MVGLKRLNRPFKTRTFRRILDCLSTKSLESILSFLFNSGYDDDVLAKTFSQSKKQILLIALV